jgi:predicted  nucleic acid-binding Zn-ribbon protein
MSNKHKQDLHTILYQLFNTIGAFTETKQLDQLRTHTSRLNTAIQSQIKEETVEFIRKLQEAISDGFEKAFNAINKVDKKLAQLEEKVNEISTCRTSQRKDTENIQSDTKT